MTYVNSSVRTPHFRHSSKDKSNNCLASKKSTEFDNPFNMNWFKLFKDEFRRPYWFNVKLEEINNDDKTIMIRYSQQKSKTIKPIEEYSKNKIIWILSLGNRPYNKIFHSQGRIYINFDGSKNDIPLYNSNKSVVYLDTGKDKLLNMIFIIILKNITNFI